MGSLRIPSVRVRMNPADRGSAVIEATEDFVPVAPKDLLGFFMPQKGWNYMFVKARFMGIPPRAVPYSYFDHEPVSGYLLIHIPPAQLIRENIRPVVGSFFTKAKRGGLGDYARMGLYPHRLEFGQSGLFLPSGIKVFDINEPAVDALTRVGAVYKPEA